MLNRAVAGAIVVVLFISVSILAQEKEEQGIESRTFVERREALMDSMKEGVAVLYSQGRQTEAGPVSEYRADGNFWYLTGVDDAGAILVLSPQEKDRQVLLLPPRDIEQERWSGRRPPLTESLERDLGFDQIVRVGSLDKVLTSRMKHTSTLHLISSPVGPSADIPPDLELYQKITARVPGTTIKNSSRLLETMRMTKSAEEIAAIERAIEVTYRGITDLLAEVRPGVTEYQLDGIMENSFKRQGAQHMAFDPIVGAGEEATVLHYGKRNRSLEAGQLLLLDVGAEWDHYTADITRTVPVDGRFTREQARIYDIVLEAEKTVIEAIKPGVTIEELQDIARDVIRDAGYIDALIHGTSHHIGLDVHDVGDNSMPLEPGNVITVEPGIYLPDEKMGVRIEDDVLVTETGHRVLSDEIPRERKDVEAWMTRAKRQAKDDS
jgi:Xaa-Pro aminopeptidase